MLKQTVLKTKEYIVSQLEYVTDSPSFEANEILIYATGIKRSKLLFKKDECLSFLQKLRVKKMVAQRRAGIPLQYIIGEWEFFGINFKVGKGVLIPRADTELSVETAVEYLSSLSQNPTVYDFCAGSGAIGISVSVNFPTAQVIMVEKSKKAFKYLRKNLEINSKNGKLNAVAIREDIFKFNPKKKCDLLISNPPYIKSDVMKSLSKEVKREPKMALDGGKDGLDFYKGICERADKYLKTGGKLIFEIGYDEAADVLKIMEQNGFVNIEILKDLCGNDRVVTGDFQPSIKTEGKNIYG